MTRNVATPAALAQRLRWELLRLWEALDTVALLAISLLALWAGLVLTVNAPLREDVRQQAVRIDALQEQAAGRQTLAGALMTRPGSREFVAFFPHTGAREKHLLKLHALAERQGLRITRADYRSEPVPELPLRRFSARLQLQGSYAQQRLFLHALLAAFPHMALESLSLEKDSSRPDAVNAQIEARFYYRSDTGPEART
jgi:hypothetical protein